MATLVDRILFLFVRRDLALRASRAIFRCRLFGCGSGLFGCGSGLFSSSSGRRVGLRDLHRLRRLRGGRRRGWTCLVQVSVPCLRGTWRAHAKSEGG